MKRGAAVRLRFAEQTVRGQVWDEADEVSVWVALEDGRYARVWTATGRAVVVDSRGKALPDEGCVAA